MLARLKRTEFGKTIYRISRHPIGGWPVLMVTRLLQYILLKFAHMFPANLAHNARARQALAQFEADQK